MTARAPIKIIITLFISILLYFPAAAQAPHETIVKATLLSETNAIEAGKPFRLAVFLEPKPGWHTYWQNPGDAGLATELSWTLPNDFIANIIDWPMPERLTEGPLTVYGYVGNVFLPVTFIAPETLAAESYVFHVKASYLVCNEICIPESTELEITLPAGKLTPSTDTPLFAAHDVRKPLILALPGAYDLNTQNVRLKVPFHALNVQKSAVKDAAFFIRESNVLNYSAPQNLSLGDDALELSIGRSEGEPPTGDLHGLLALTTETGQKNFDILFSPSLSMGEAGAQRRVGGDATSSSLSTAPPPNLPPQGGEEIFLTLLFALLGGLILNLMPCVLPVLSLKALAVAKKAGAEKPHVLKQGIAYTLGILVSFAAFAGVLLMLKEAGNAVGWGFQMQSPAFVGFLIYLLFLVGLNLSGFFHLPVLLGNIGITDEQSAKGSFFTGVLATAVATPCTAPFMASAVGAALTLPAWQSMLVFEALGLGLALPFLLISIFPHLLRFLPKPGAWMETFKKILALPMYASVIWLLWVLAQQTGNGGVIVAITGMLSLTAAIALKHYRMVVELIFAAVFITSLLTLSRMESVEMVVPLERVSHQVETVPYSPAKLDALRAAGKPVFVDATAAWCITCQVNARVAIHTDRTMQLFRDRGITLMIADWTRRNEDITRFLSSFGYQGVPLYVYYPSHDEPKVLPQLLTPDVVAEAIAR